MNRDLDTVYFRVERDGAYYNVCFSDLSKDERARMLDGRDEKWLKHLCCILADCLKDIGDTFDIVGGYESEEE